MDPRECSEHKDAARDTCSLCDTEFCTGCMDMEWCERCKIVYCADCSTPDDHPEEEHEAVS